MICAVSIDLFRNAFVGFAKLGILLTVGPPKAKPISRGRDFVMSAGLAPATLIPVLFVRPVVPKLAIPEALTCAIPAVSIFAAFLANAAKASGSSGCAS